MLGLQILRWTELETMYGVALRLSCLTSLKYMRGKRIGVESFVLE